MDRVTRLEQGFEYCLFWQEFEFVCFHLSQIYFAIICFSCRSVIDKSYLQNNAVNISASQPE